MQLNDAAVPPSSPTPPFPLSSSIPFPVRLCCSGRSRLRAIRFLPFSARRPIARCLFLFAYGNRSSPCVVPSSRSETQLRTERTPPARSPQRGYSAGLRVPQRVLRPQRVWRTTCSLSQRRHGRSSRWCRPSTWSLAKAKGASRCIANGAGVCPRCLLSVHRRVSGVTVDAVAKPCISIWNYFGDRLDHPTRGHDVGPVLWRSRSLRRGCSRSEFSSRIVWDTYGKVANPYRPSLRPRQSLCHAGVLPTIWITSGTSLLFRLSPANFAEQPGR